MNKIKSEKQPGYLPAADNAADNEIIRKATAILKSRFFKSTYIENPAAIKDYLKMHYGLLEHEIFSLTLLDNRHGVIDCIDLFRGTIDGASVHPREVVKTALQYNAAAVILSHNHPSGKPEPSRADISLTKRLVDSLALVDVKVLDHIVCGGIESVSFAERGLI